jgi:FHS family L-fucose permease-like MFS transporter
MKRPACRALTWRWPAALAILAVLFALARLPKISHGEETTAAASGKASALAYRHLVLGAVAIFLYVGGEVSIGSFLVNFLGEQQIAGLAPAVAAGYVSLYWGGALIGRFIGFAVMRYVSPGKSLAFNSLVAIALVLTGIFGKGRWRCGRSWRSACSIRSCSRPSSAWPCMAWAATPARARASCAWPSSAAPSCPFVQGALADTIGLQTSFFVPAACYAFILYFGLLRSETGTRVVIRRAPELAISVYDSSGHWWSRPIRRARWRSTRRTAPSKPRCAATTTSCITASVKKPCRSHGTSKPW